MNFQMLSQAQAYYKVRTVKALSAAQALASDLTEVTESLDAATETLTAVGAEVAQLRSDVDGLLP